MKAETDATVFDATVFDDTVQWLLAGDPSIRWQTLRDLVEADAGAVERERK